MDFFYRMENIIYQKSIQDLVVLICMHMGQESISFDHSSAVTVAPSDL